MCNFCTNVALYAGATAYAALVKAVNQGMVSADEEIVVLNTGNGLKDVASAMKSIDLVGPQPYRVELDLDDLEQVVSGMNVTSNL